MCNQIKVVKEADAVLPAVTRPLKVAHVCLEDRVDPPPLLLTEIWGTLLANLDVNVTSRLSHLLCCLFGQL